MFSSVRRELSQWKRPSSSGSKLKHKRKKSGGEPKGEVDADKTATQGDTSKETSLLVIGSDFEGDDLVSLGFDLSLHSWRKIGFDQLIAGLQKDEHILVAIQAEMKNNYMTLSAPPIQDERKDAPPIQDEMKDKYKTLSAPPTVRMWLRRAKELSHKIIEEEMGYKNNHSIGRYWVEMMVKTCLQLIVEGSMLNVYPDIAHTPPRVRLMPAHPFLGQSPRFGSVVDFLHSGNNNNTGTILGIYGMGAVGKTALMHRVNNYLALTYDFHLVIWIHVSRGDDIPLRVQRDILSRLGLPCDEDKGQNRRYISSSLLCLRFVLLLDELWEKVDLQEVGLPTSHIGKVVFTTRSKEVCRQMNAEKPITVECLPLEEAQELLHYNIASKENNIGPKESPLDQKHDIANSVAECCHGLPLALVIVGSYMKRRSSLEDWERTLAALTNVDNQTALRNVDNQTGPSENQTILFSLLKLIYNDLPSDDSRLCLSASSSFPKYLAVRKLDLIRFWRKKKNLPGTMDATELEKGNEIVQTLVDASLLESKGKYDPYVKLHPVLHDILSWIEENKEGWTEAAMKQAPNFLENDDVKKMQETMRSLPFKSSESSCSQEIQEEFSGDLQQNEKELGARNKDLEPWYGMPTTQHNELLPNIGAGKSLAKTTDELHMATDSREAGDGSSSSHAAGLFKPDHIVTFPTEPDSTLESAMDRKDKDVGKLTIKEEATNKVSDIGPSGNVTRNVEGSMEAEAPSAKSHVGPEVDPSSKHHDEHLYLPAEEEPSAKQLVGIAIANKSSSPSNDNIIPETPPADSGESSLLPSGVAPPATDTPISKQTEICKKVLSLLDDDNITMVALWGPRGVGKSTLLKRIETEVQRLPSFKVVIRVVLPVSGNIEQKIVDDIAHELGVVTRSGDQQRRDINHKLLRRRFLLLFDDLKGPSELKNIGIPLPLEHNSGKIIFTSTTSNVSQYRECQAVQVARLDHEEAWELFKKEIGEEALRTSNPTTLEHAKEITKECHGLPLAIKLLAGIMKRKDSPQEWQDMKLQMTDKQSIEPDNLEKICQFSLSSLQSYELDCFMFTCLLPKDYWINEIDLIDYWIGEGFLSSGCNSVNEATKKGQDVLELLKTANLLEEQAQNRHIHKAVKMHDTLREMDLGYINVKTELVEAGMGLNEAPAYEKWETAKRISIMANKITGFRKAPRCYHLITLLLNRNHHLRELPKEFFNFAPSLQVLDLSHCGLHTLPPSIVKAVKLQYLNLSSTEINSLPKELEKLTMLKCLKLRETTALHSIPEGILSKFVNLQLLDMFHSGFALRKENSDKIIDEMEDLKQLGIIGICIENFGSLERLSKGRVLARKLAYLRMSYCVNKVSIELLSTFATMESLRELYISSCPSLEAITVHQEQGRSIEGFKKLPALETLNISHNNYLKKFQVTNLPQQCLENLRKLEVSYCPLVKSVSWVQCLPNLINLLIESNDKMKDLFGERMAGRQDCFPKLRFITLCNLSSLQNIGDSMDFPSLESLVISRCPKVRNLPAGIRSKNLKEIRGDIKWWKNLIWADEAFKSSLLPLYKREVTLWN